LDVPENFTLKLSLSVYTSAWHWTAVSVGDVPAFSYILSVWYVLKHIQHIRDFLKWQCTT